MRAELVRDALERVLGSPEFDASERNRRFLAHIIDETMAGRADRLKGLSIAVDVFGRDVATFDSERDPVVRIEAAKLRRSLERYYLTAGKHDALRIEIPKGTYVPSFLQHGAPAADGAARLPVPEPRPTAAARAGRRLRSSGVAAALGGVAALAVTAAWLWLSPSAAVMDEEPVAAGMQLEGPAVIMVPFEDLTGSEAGRLFAGGLTEELIANLMRFANLRIFAASGDEPTSRRLSEQLSVGYRIQGSVRRAPHRLRLVVHLIDVENGRYVWSETYDRSLSAAGIVDLQAEIAAEIAGRLGEPYGVINEVTADLFRRHRPDTLLAYDCVLKAFAYRRVVDVERYRETRGCLEQAVRDDPHYAVAWAMLAFALLDEYRWYGFGTRHGVAAALDEALAAAQRALELDPADVMTLSAYAAVQFYRGETAEALATQRRAVDLNPNNAEVRAQLGWRLAFTEDWDGGMAQVREAARQSMAGRGWYYLVLAIDDYRRADYRAALADLERLAGPFFFLRPALQAMCEAGLGNPERARRALQEALALDPSFARDPRAAFRLHRTPEDLIERFIDGLRAAGLEIPRGQT